MTATLAAVLASAAAVPVQAQMGSREGTPLSAMAAGNVIARGEGGAGQARMPPGNGRLSDSMLMFLSPGADADKVAELPAAGKRLSVAVADSNGNIFPAGSRVIWPTRCSGRAR